MGGAMGEHILVVLLLPVVLALLTVLIEKLK
jgi:hypothetical protein